MYNIKFTLSDGSEVFPNYMSLEQRQKLKEDIGDKREVMWCSCRNDIRLFYRLSENFRFYPEHNGYEHDPNCTRYHTQGSKRKTPIIHSDDETTIVFLKFNPKNFTIPTMKETDLDEQEENDFDISIDSLETDVHTEEEVIHLDKLEVDSINDKEPDFNLSNFVRCINLDTYMERIINNKNILPHGYFSNALFGRLKNIKIGGMKKNIRSLSLEEDGLRFFYSKFAGCDIKTNNSRKSYYVKVNGTDNKIYSLFTFGGIYEKALKKFHKEYGIEPDEYTMVAGFQYYPLSGNNSHYKVIGRMHLFQVSDHGLYCRSMFEQSCYNIITNYVLYNKREKIRFYIPPEDDFINGIIEIPGHKKKGILIFSSSTKTKELSINTSLFEPLIIQKQEEFNNNVMASFIEKIKSS